MAKATDGIKSAFNKLGKGMDFVMDKYSTTFGVGLVASYALLGLGAFTAVSGYLSAATVAGHSLGMLWGGITGGSVIMMGGGYVVLPLIATTFLIEEGVNMYKKHKAKPSRNMIAKT